MAGAADDNIGLASGQDLIAGAAAVSTMARRPNGMAFSILPCGHGDRYRKFFLDDNEGRNDCIRFNAGVIR